MVLLQTEAHTTKRHNNVKVNTLPTVQQQQQKQHQQQQQQYRHRRHRHFRRPTVYIRLYMRNVLQRTSVERVPVGYGFHALHREQRIKKYARDQHIKICDRKTPRAVCVKCVRLVRL